ncbi:MAG: type II secretion system protein [Armatimonadetes bacterium]|nr:type II secretion system protein [Armatimonadota bacterium]MDE2206330.1 type II secretion system protein [Armatimonadota bacterium]
MQSVKHARNLRGRKGFTLIELLVVVLILSILMAVALPLYLAAVADSQKKTCRANMQTIANAVEAARVEGNWADYTTAIGAAIGPTVEPDLKAEPVCPTAGTYSIEQGSSGDNTTFKVACTVHGTFEPGVDSN